MYSVVSETDDSTTVNFTAYGKFMPGSSGQQLVTIGGKYLRVFRTNPYALVPSGMGDEWQQRTKLECVFTSRFLSPVKSFASARLSCHPESDALLLAFDDGKLSIVALDERSRDLVTLSLHSYEDEELREGNTKNFPTPVVRADPGSRCAAMLVYGKYLSVVPLNEGMPKSWTIPLKQIDNRLENIVDITFLDGYYEPTLLFLYEPLQTTAGRASIRYDTMCIMGVSVNTSDRHFAVVWQLSSLPMDGNSLLPIPKPIGGAVVFGSNDLVYINQAVPSSGLMLNSCYDNFTKFPLKDMRSLVLALDCSCSDYLGSGRIAIGTLDGSLYILSLLTDNTSTVRSLSLVEVFKSSIPFCLAQCAPGHLFVGSRLGDSQLLKYSVQRKLCENGKNDAKVNGLDQNEEDMELYGENTAEEMDIDSLATEEVWEFEELDRLSNVGPIKSITAGGAHGTSPVLLEKSRVDPIYCFWVGASGHAENGSLCIFQRTVRPDIITSSSLDGAQQMWAVGQNEDGSHKYLIVSRQRSTLVLELGEEMVELEDPIFITTEATIAAGELADGGLVVQVASMCLALVAEGQQLQEIQLASNFPVVAASIVDPYVALLTQNGRLMLFQLAVEPYVHLKELDVSSITSGGNFSAITSISVYKDMSGIMLLEGQLGHDRAVEIEKTKENGTLNQNAATAMDDDDWALYGKGDIEDTLLYGDASTSQKKIEPDFSRKKRRGVVVAATGGEESDAIDPNTVLPTFWLIIARDSGRLVIYSLPTLHVVYQIKKFCGMHQLLTDAADDDDDKERLSGKQAKDSEDSTIEQNLELLRHDERIVEILIYGMGISQGHPILTAVVDDLLIAYEMFRFPNSRIDHLCIGFKRIAFTLCLRSSPYMGPEGRRNDVQLGRESRALRSILQPFDRIGSIQHGIWVSGDVPCILLYGACNGFCHHLVSLDGAVRSFTPFNNRNVANGFLYLTEISQELRIARLQDTFNYELPLPCQKVHVGATIHFVRYLMQQQVFAVVTSVPKKTNKIWVVVNDDKQEETHEKPDSFVLPIVPQYRLDLYSPEDWQPVPNTGLDLEELEVVTACEEVALRSESTVTGMQTFLALGTINNYGEEHLVRGRIIIAEIIEVVPDPDKPTSKHKLKYLYQAEQKMPVTAICSMNGFLLTGMGQKIFIWGFKDNELQGVSFLDMHYYVHSLVGFRNLALACDIQSSLSLIRFQEQFKALSIASRDDRQNMNPPLQSQYLIDGKHVAFLMSDECGNIIMFNYMPEVKESIGGEKLVLRGCVNVGTNIHAWIRVRGHTSLCDMSMAEAKVVSQHETTLWASLDGSFGFVRPISEKSFRRLSFLQQVMTTTVRQTCGLNPKGARSIRPPRPVINAGNHRNMVDGDVVSQFMHLSTVDKQDIARRLGASRYHIMDDIVNIQRMASFY